jgi:hypothetical protein
MYHCLRNFGGVVDPDPVGPEIFHQAIAGKFFPHSDPDRNRLYITFRGFLESTVVKIAVD